jgi:hypothetical protein
MTEETTELSDEPINPFDPDGNGDMPLTCAAQWDATEGLKVPFDDVSREKRAASYRRILDLLVSGKIKATGRPVRKEKPGDRKPMEAFLFVDCAIHLPDFDDIAAYDFKDRKVLRSWAYETMEAWRSDFDDQLLQGRDAQWRQIYLPKNEVKTHLAHSGPIYKTGTPGRPSSKHLIMGELKKRAADKYLEPKLSQQAAALVEWLHREHRDAPQLTKLSCENAIRDAYNAYMKPIKLST